MANYLWLGYERLSKDRSGLSENCEIQKAEIDSYIAELDPGAQIIHFSDNDISASKFSDKPRPGYEHIIQTIKSYDDVLPIRIAVTEMTRLYRRMPELLDVIKLAETSKLRGIWTTDDIGYDLSTPLGVHAAIAAVNNAMLESAVTSKRIKRKKAAKAIKGEWGGGARRYGYSADNKTLVEAEVEVIRRCATWYTNGYSANTIAKRLNDQGVKTVNGKEWMAGNLQKLLLNRRYVGMRVYQGAEYRATWPAIFTEEEWQLMDAMRRGKVRNFPKGPTGARSYLLTGFGVCGNCGGKIVGNKARGQRRYKCYMIDNRGVRVGCGKVYRIADPVEIMVKEALIKHLENKNVPSVDKGRMQALLDQQSMFSLRIAEADRDYYVEAQITKTQYTKIKSELEHKLEDIGDELATLLAKRNGIQLKSGQTLEEAWDEASLAAKRSLVNLHIEKVIFNPGHPGFMMFNGFRFNPKYIEIVMSKPVLV